MRDGDKTQTMGFDRADRPGTKENRYGVRGIFNRTLYYFATSWINNCGISPRFRYRVLSISIWGVTCGPLYEIIYRRLREVYSLSSRTAGVSPLYLNVHICDNSYACIGIFKLNLNISTILSLSLSFSVEQYILQHQKCKYYCWAQKLHVGETGCRWHIFQNLKNAIFQTNLSD